MSFLRSFILALREALVAKLVISNILSSLCLIFSTATSANLSTSNYLL